MSGATMPFPMGAEIDRTRGDIPFDGGQPLDPFDRSVIEAGAIDDQPRDQA